MLALGQVTPIGDRRRERSIKPEIVLESRTEVFRCEPRADG